MIGGIYVDKNILGVILSFIYFFGLLLLSQKINVFSLEGKRKFVHIMLGNWWLIVIILINNAFFASIVPVSFIFINYFSLKRNKKGGLLSELERKEGPKSYGIVLYPISMEITVLLSFLFFKDIRVGGLGLIALSYGDGVAALIGKKFEILPMTIWGNKKTISGTLAMFVTTSIIIIFYLLSMHLCTDNLLCVFIGLGLAFVSSITEMISPFGIDDLTVPLSVFFVYYLLAY